METPPTTPPSIPEANLIDYAPATPANKHLWWRILLAIYSTLCVAIGGGLLVAAILSGNYDRVPFAGIGTGFVIAGLGLPIAIVLVKRI